MIWLDNLLFKEGTMRRTMVMVVIGMIVLTAFHPAGAEEDLFDTAAAAAHIEKGIAALKNKDYDSAIIELEAAVSIDPEAESYYYLGYAYYMKGRTKDGDSRKKSLEAFERVYELDPGFTPSGPSLTETRPTGSSEPAETETAPTVTSSPGAQEPSSSSPEPTETGPASPGSSEPESESTPQMQPEERKAESDVPSHPSTPVKATDRVGHLGSE
jgi:tetratricopeptide (TPR) repeat protein